MKKLLAIVLSLLMVMSLAVPAMAAPVDPTDTSGSITISGAIEGVTYNAYKIFNLESYDGDKATYKVAGGWSDFVTAQSAILTLDDQGYVTWTGAKDAATVEKFAKDALDYAKTKNIAVAGTATGTAVGETTITGLTLGYYVVDSSLGALCSLNTTTPNVTMTEKNTEPSLKKEVKEDSTNTFGKTNNADIGDKVEYKITVTVAKNAAHHIKIVDKMSAGLTFNNDVAVEGVTDTSNAFEVVTTGLEDGVTFEVRFKDDYVNSLFTDADENSTTKEIVITYTATVNEKAVIRNEGNTNEATLKYGDDYEIFGEPDETKTYVYDFILKKFTKNAEGEEEILAGAGFVLYKGEGESRKYAKFTVDGNTYTLDKETPWVDSKDAATTITTTTERITIKGLDADTYGLEETVVPDGYNKVDPDPEVIIAQDTGDVTGSITETVGESIFVNVVKVENKSGSKLPETGGIGTTIFYVVGGLMMTVAVVLLVTKKKVNGK